MGGFFPPPIGGCCEYLFYSYQSKEKKGQSINKFIYNQPSLVNAEFFQHFFFFFFFFHFFLLLLLSLSLSLSQFNLAEE